jgi:hypothetical protein
MGTEAQATGIVQSLLKGDYATVIQIALVFALVHYGAYVIAYLASKAKEGINWLKGKANELPLLQATTIDDRFFDLMTKAVSNQAHLQEALTNAVADGTISKEDLQKFAVAIWTDMKANMGIADWSSFALALLGNSQTPGTETEKALRGKFDASVFSLIGKICQEIATFKTEKRMVRARALGMK